MSSWAPRTGGQRRRSSSDPDLYTPHALNHTSTTATVLPYKRLLPSPTMLRALKTSRGLSIRDLTLLLVGCCAALPVVLVLLSLNHDDSGHGRRRLSLLPRTEGNDDNPVVIRTDRELSFQFGDGGTQREHDQACKQHASRREGKRQAGEPAGSTENPLLAEEMAKGADLPPCEHSPANDAEPDTLLIEPDTNLTAAVCECEIERENADVSSGGAYTPGACRSAQRVLLVVPYRDRPAHLRIFVRHMHRFLRGQNLDYRIFIVEQVGNQSFNRGKLLNVGFTEAQRLGYDYDCVISHDVDLLPENPANLYLCTNSTPRHMSAAIKQNNYKLTYKTAFGGVNAVSKDMFKMLNGYPNNNWNWGQEDDNFSKRLRLNHFEIARYPSDVARYTMIGHTKYQGNPPNYCNKILQKVITKTWKDDGLSSLEYTLVNVTLRRLYTLLTVDLMEKASVAKLKTIYYYDKSKKKKNGTRPVIACHMPLNI